LNVIAAGNREMVTETLFTPIRTHFPLVMSSGVAGGESRLGGAWR
jgi:hypothetical protein